MAQRIFLVDVEASGKSPFSGVMTEFGVVDFETRSWFHGHLWDFEPHPDIPALPVPTVEQTGVTRCAGPDGEPQHTAVPNARAVFEHLAAWIDMYAGPCRENPAGDRPVFVADNPGFDAMWMTEAFDRNGVDNPFGTSSRRIGDLAAGLSGKWKNTSAWKRHRKTRHDHNPVNDALGNAEALETILRQHEQKF